MELLYEFLFKSSCRLKTVLNFLVHSSYFLTSRHVVACGLLYDKTFTSVIYKCSYCFRIRKQEEQGRRILHGTAYVVLCPHHTNVSVQFRDLVGQYLRSLLTYHLKPWYVSLTDPYQNLIENTVQGPIYITMRKEKQNWPPFYTRSIASEQKRD